MLEILKYMKIYKISWKELLEYQEKIGGLLLVSGEEENFLMEVISIKLTSLPQVRSYSYVPQRRRNKKIGFKNLEWKADILKSYRDSFKGFLIWIIPSVMAVVISFWIEFPLLGIVGMTVGIFRLLAYLVHFIYVHKDLYFIKQIAKEEEVFHDGSKFSYDEICLLNNSDSEILYFKGKGEIWAKTWIIWTIGKDRKKLKNLFGEFVQEQDDLVDMKLLELIHFKQ